MSTLSPRQNAHSGRRRSQRVMLSVAVRISGTNANGVAFTEDTSTNVVNAHGGLVLLKAAIRQGQRLKIMNLKTDEETVCVAVDQNAGSSEACEVGVEFDVESPRFWRVSFPPEDWTPHSPEAKRVGSPKPDRSVAPPIPIKK